MGPNDTLEALLEGVLERFALFWEYRPIWIFVIEILGDGERVGDDCWRGATRVDESGEGVVWFGGVAGFG